MTNKHRLLSFQGGGVKGIVALTILDRLYKKELIKYDEVYSYAGSSTGSLVAALCCIGYSPSQSIDIYKRLSPKIFKRFWYLPKILDVLLWAAPYDVKVLYSEIKNIVGDKKIGDLKRKIVIPVFNIDGKFNNQRSYSTIMINNHVFYRDGKKVENIFLDWPLADVLTGACCAPTYFNRIKTGIARGFRDSGLTDNLACLSNYSICKNGDAEKESVMLGIGNGIKYPYKSNKTNKFWKLPDTLRSVGDSITIGNESLTDLVLTSIYREKYLYFNKPYKKDVDLDDFKKIPDLIEWAENLDISELEQWIGKYWS